jgi:hypothetical protein
VDFSIVTWVDKSDKIDFSHHHWQQEQQQQQHPLSVLVKNTTVWGQVRVKTALK